MIVPQITPTVDDVELLAIGLSTQSATTAVRPRKSLPNCEEFAATPRLCCRARPLGHNSEPRGPVDAASGGQVGIVHRRALTSVGGLLLEDGDTLTTETGDTITPE